MSKMSLETRSGILPTGGRVTFPMLQESVELTWQEVAKHNTRKSAWVIIDHKVYDVTTWIDQHPGGASVVLLALGRDTSEAFHTYHWNTKKVQQVLKKYEIGRFVGRSELPVFTERGNFFKVVKQRVLEYFERTGQDKTFHWKALLGYFSIFTFIFIFYYLLFFVNAVQESWVLSGLMSVAVSLVKCSWDFGALKLVYTHCMMQVIVHLLIIL